MSNFMKIRPMGAEIFHADGRTDITNLIVAPKNVSRERIDLHVLQIFQEALCGFVLFMYVISGLQH